MKDEKLTALGETLRQEFQQLLRSCSVNCLDSDYTITAEVQTLHLLEADIDRIARASSEFTVIEEIMTSGFFPADLALDSTKAAMRLTGAERASAPRLFESNQQEEDGQSMIGIAPESEATSTLEAKSGRPWQQERSSALKGLKDFAGFLESTSQAESILGRNFSLRGNPADDQVRTYGDSLKTERRSLSAEENVQPERYLQSLSPMGEMFIANGSLLDASSDNETPNIRPQTELTSEEKYLHVANIPSLTKLFSNTCIEDDDLEQNALLSFPHGFGQRQSTDASFFKKQSWKASKGAPSSAEFEKIQRRSVRKRQESDSDSLTPKPLIAGDPELDSVEEYERPERPSPHSDTDVNDLLDALAREIQREYKRFYGS